MAPLRPQERPRSRERWLAILALVVATVAITTMLQHGSLHALTALQPSSVSGHRRALVEPTASADGTIAAAGSGAAVAAAAAATLTAGSVTAARPLLVPEDEAAAAAGLSRSMPMLGNISSRWAPLIISQCTDRTPPHFAPCLVGPKNPALAYGEELIYPAFSIPLPGFFSEEDEKWWKGAAGEYAPERYVLRPASGAHGAALTSPNRAVFAAQHGQNLVFRNVAWRGNPASDVWGDGVCMFPRVSHKALVPLNGEEPAHRGRAVLANTPLSFILQHFLDRVAKILVQTEGWRQNGTHIIAGASTSLPHVLDVYDALMHDNGQQEVDFGMGEFSAEELVFPCRTPLIHPYFNERLREQMQLPEPAPLEQRKVVLYLSRNNDANCGERKVLNEDAVLDAIREVLKERNRGEELVMFDRSKFPHVADLAAYMAANVSAIVGPHGGAWYNVWWAARDTLLLEFMPTSRIAVMIWEEGSIIGLRYYVVVCPSEAPKHDITPDLETVKRGLREQLGVASTGPSEPQFHSDWDLDQLLT